MRTLSTVKTLGELLTSIKNKSLIPDPEFQRKLVWTSKDKKKFLETVLNGYPFPEIYIAAGSVDLETGEATQLLVDGQQRMTTLYQYFLGIDDLRLGRDIKSYSNLSKEEKLAFLEYQVVVRNIGKISIDEIKNIFERINATSYSLNAIERHNSQFNGELMTFAKDLAQNSFFESHRVFSSNDIRRMNDVTFVLTLIITLMYTYFTREDMLEKYLSNYNDEFEQKEQIAQEINEVINFIERCSFDNRSRIWKKSDLLTLLVEIHKATAKKKSKLVPSDVKRALESFYNKVDIFSSSGREDDDPIVQKDVTEYYKAALQGTNDRTSRIKRGEIIAKILTSLSEA